MEKKYNIIDIEELSFVSRAGQRGPQINADNQYAREFADYFCSIAEKVVPQELSSWRREVTDKSAKDILELINKDSVTLAGIQVFRQPRMKIHEYQKWEGGYIEGFVRVDGNDGKEYFLWAYIKMDKLKEILDKFKTKIYCFG